MWINFLPNVGWVRSVQKRVERLYIPSSFDNLLRTFPAGEGVTYALSSAPQLEPEGRTMTRRIQSLAFAGLTIALVVGCGVKKETHQKALDELAATQNRLSDAQRDRDAKAKQLAKLEKELSELQAQRDTLTEAERQAQARMQASEQELVELRKQRDAAEQRLTAFRQLYERFRALVDTGKLQVDFRNGQMVLKLPSEVLFSSGKARLSDRGEKALTEVLNILVEFKDRRFLIAGHTDNLPLRGGKFDNNWELSTARALEVLEYMVKAGFDPKNLGAAGYGEFDPVAPNDTDQNRQLNRRIEIILVPDLSELPNLTVNPS
jgi:chemotaxis protein MotB